jgi:predicted nuclease with TOPRIM domain
MVDKRLGKVAIAMSTTAECKKKLASVLDEAKGLHSQVKSIDTEMDDLLARLTSLSAERDRLAARHEVLNDEAETVEEELDRLQRRERRKSRKLSAKKRVHETTQVATSVGLLEEGDTESLAIASRFMPEKKSAEAA